jgi:hypothetical protein
VNDLFVNICIYIKIVNYITNTNPPHGWTKCAEKTVIVQKSICNRIKYFNVIYIYIYVCVCVCVCVFVGTNTQ